MSIKELFKELVINGFTASQKPYWDAVGNQGRVHNRRLDGAQVDLINRARPDENEMMTKYRIDNFRQITYPSISKHKTKVKRVLNFTVDLSDILKNEGFDPFELSYKIVDDIYENPNVVYFVLPYVGGEDDKLIPPSTIGKDNKPLISLIEINKERLIYYDKDYVCFRYIDIKTKEYTKPTYLFADKNKIYLARPVIIDKKETYELIDWYVKIPNDLKIEFIAQTPFTPLPGVPSRTIDNKYYLETFFKGAYEFYDEALMTFSDSQVVAWRYNYPKPVMAEIKCMAEGCEDGILYTYDKLGAKLKGENGIPLKNKCKVCSGTGLIKDPTLFKTLTYPQNSVLTGTQSNRPLLEYVTPDVGIIQSSFQRPMDMVKLGDKSIGLDLLEDAGANSSDMSLERRMEDLLDMIKNIGNGLYDALDNIMYNIELIRNPFVKNVAFTKVKRPSSFSIMTTSNLKVIADASYPEDRIESKMDMYRNKYKNDERLLNIYRLILYVDPMSTMTYEEIQDRLASDILNSYDTIRNMYIFKAIEYIYDNNKYVTVENATKEVKKYLIDNGLWIEPKTEKEKLIENKLLQTVGGVKEKQ